MQNRQQLTGHRYKTHTRHSSNTLFYSTISTPVTGHWRELWREACRDPDNLNRLASSLAGQHVVHQLKMEGPWGQAFYNTQNTHACTYSFHRTAMQPCPMKHEKYSVRIFCRLFVLMEKLADVGYEANGWFSIIDSSVPRSQTPVLPFFLVLLPCPPSPFICLPQILCTLYGAVDLYGPLRNAFDAASIHYEGKWERVGPFKMASSWVPFGTYKTPRGRLQGPYCGGWGSRCIKELNRPAPGPDKATSIQAFGRNS